MTALVPVIWALTAFSLTSTVILIGAARRESIGALTERAIVALVMLVHGAAFALVAYNAEAGYPLWDRLTGMAALRVTVCLLLTVPIYWLILYVTGRLGDNGKGGT